MPVNPRKEALTLSQFKGQEIHLSAYPLIKKGTKGSSIGRLSDGREIWLPNHVVDRFEPKHHEGRYLVVAFPTEFGNEGYTLENVPQSADSSPPATDGSKQA